MVTIANNTLRDSIYGMIYRVTVGAILSITDGVTDLIVITNYYKNDALVGQAHLLLIIVSVNLFFQLVVVMATYSKSSRARPSRLLPSSPPLAAHRRGICPCCSPASCVCALACTNLVLFPAVDLALLVAEPRLVVAVGAQSQHPRRSSFGLTGEAGWDGHRGRARVV